MNSNIKSTNQLSIMIIITIVIQVISLYKSSLIASNFGISVEMDSLNFTMSTIGMIFGFISAGISSVLIPNLIKKDSNNATNSFITMIILVSMCIVIINFIFGKNIMVALSGNSNPKFIEFCSKIVPIVSVTSFLGVICEIQNSILQTNNIFNIQKLITLFTSIILIAFFVFIPNINVTNYSLMLLLISIITLIITSNITRRENYKYKFKIVKNDNNYIEMKKSFIPIILSSAFYQVSLLIDNMISTRLGDGQISILNYSNVIVSMINIMFLGNITTFLYPKLARNYNDEELKDNIFKYITLINIIICLLVIGFIIVGEAAIEVIYNRGVINSKIIDIIFKCCLIYIIALPINATKDLIYKYFFIKGDTRTPFINSVTVSIINIIISIILCKYLGLYGVALGTTIGNFISLFMIIFRLYLKRELPQNFKKIVKNNFFIIISSIITLLVNYGIKNNILIDNKIVYILFYGIVTIVIYIIVTYLLNKNMFNENFINCNNRDCR